MVAESGGTSTVAPEHASVNQMHDQFWRCATTQASWMITAVTMPNIPSLRSIWLRMWQWHAQTPGSSERTSTG